MIITMQVTQPSIDKILSTTVTFISSNNCHQFNVNFFIYIHLTPHKQAKQRYGLVHVSS